jgi:hypothetical protein
MERKSSLASRRQTLKSHVRLVKYADAGKAEMQGLKLQGKKENRYTCTGVRVSA